MSEYEKGDIVVVTAAGWGHWASGGGGTEYRVGEELVVTSTRTQGYVSVRPAPPAAGSVFKIPTSRIRPVPRMIGVVPAGGIPADHPGLEWLFEDAARMADRLDLCRDFDRLCDALGIPGRIRTFTVSLLSEDGLTVTAKVEARSMALAQQKVRDRLAGTGAEPLALETNRAVAS